MASLVDLLRYKEEVEIRHPKTGEVLRKVWVRILGDFDLNKAYKASRIASNEKRAALRNPETEDYKDEVLGLIELSRMEQVEVIKTARLASFATEAQVAVDRPELPKLEEIALDPDGPSLEELEKLDKEEEEVETTYQSKIQEYIDTKQKELEDELEKKSDKEILELAQIEISNVIPFSIFMNELTDYKLLYGVFKDHACKEREFQSIEDVKNTPSSIKDQIIFAMNRLELGQTEIKN